MNKFQKLGWIAAAAMGGVLLAGGFRDDALKIGVVDIADVVNKSNFGIAGHTTFDKMRKNREDLLQFIDTNRVLTNEQAQQLKTLWIKDAPTAEDTATIERLKADVVASNKRWTELTSKTNLTQDDRTLLDEYAKRGQNMDIVMQKWVNDFSNEVQAWADKQKATSYEKARTAVKTVASSQGYTVVFDVSIAPYGANDLTDAALKAMNANP